MSSVSDVMVAVASGSGGTLLVQGVVAYLRSRAARHSADRTNDARLEEHRDDLTFQLLEAAKDDIRGLRQEVETLRPISMRVLHLEEALDHLEAVLQAASGDELERAKRRARDFLKRMRPGVGDLRQAAQRHESAKRVRGEEEGDNPGKAP